MHLDQILFLCGGGLLLLAVILAVFLLRSRGKSREYRQALQEETIRLDIVSTVRETKKLAEAGQGTLSLVGQEAIKTEILPQEDRPTQPLSSENTVSLSAADIQTEKLQGEEPPQPVTTIGLDLSPLKGKYELLREIHGGGMSRVFLARHCKLGNEWIVKYVEGAELANEAEVLKKLNHISLPQIIDIFENRTGIFLVERYIEGCSLEEVLKLGGIKEGQIRDWGIQLAQVLRYLHTLETPIIHCDLKPSNIMVTYDNRLVLIDFGISKRQGVSERDIGLTYSYAAPEQFQGVAARSEAILSRFGVLPPEQSEWKVDQRTDLYSAGAILFTLLTGQTPNWKNQRELYDHASTQLADIICKCLEVDPAQRYQSAQELEEALSKLMERQISMARSLVLRRVAAACCAVCLVGGTGVSASAVYVNQMENLSLVSMEPGRAVVTAQQGVQILVEKTTPKGETLYLEPHQIQWSYSEDNIARLDGDRLVGLNPGQVTLYGKYRNKIITLDVTVTEPVGELVDVALRYPEGTAVSVYAGSGERELEDGTLPDCAFVSPESLSADGQSLYISDGGVLRVLENGEASTIYLEPDFLTASLVRPWGGMIYLLTGPWEAEDGEQYYGFLRLSEDGAEFLYYTEAVWSVVTDFRFSSDGTLWFIQQNMGTGTTSLNTLGLDTLEAAWVMDLPDGAANMVFDSSDTLYISVPDSGVILRVGSEETAWSYFAGVEGERNFIDGAIPNFYRPTSLAAEGNALYVLDFDTVRKITVDGAGALFTETMAGIPTEDTNPDVALGEGGTCVLPASELAALALDGDGRLLLSGPKSSVIYEIVTPH